MLRFQRGLGEPCGDLGDGSLGGLVQRRADERRSWCQIMSTKCETSLTRSVLVHSCKPVRLTTPRPYNPAIAFHRFANSARSPEVMSRAIASRSRIAVSGKTSGSSARAAVSSSLAEARTSWAAGTGQT